MVGNARWAAANLIHEIITKIDVSAPPRSRDGASGFPPYRRWNPFVRGNVEAH